MKRFRYFVWYLAKRLFVLCCIMGVLSVSFYYAMNASNIYVVIKDGLAKRAKVVMMGVEENELNKYFSDSYLLRDQRLLSRKNGTTPYIMYDIKGIDHRLKMEWMWCWPWENTARAVVSEKIPAVDGRIIASYKQQTNEKQWQVPSWGYGKYNIFLYKENGHWHIRDMQLISDRE